MFATNNEKNYSPAVLETIYKCFKAIQHCVKIELYKLSKFGPCTIMDIDLRYHIELWAKGYFQYCLRQEFDSLNYLLEDLGLPAVEKTVYENLTSIDEDAAEDLCCQMWETAVEFVEIALQQNWKELCEQFDNEEERIADNFRRRSDLFAPDKEFIKPAQYTPAARKLLEDCFCYMHERISPMSEYFIPNRDQLSMIVAIEEWLYRVYGSHGDKNSFLKIVSLICGIFGIDVTDAVYTHSVHFWKSKHPVTFHTVARFSYRLTTHICNCLIDLWDELEEEYLHADFHKIHLSDFAPVEM